MLMVNVRLLSTYFAGLSAAMTAFGQSTWDGQAGTGAWGTGLNWSPNQVPGNVVLTFDGLHANSQYNISLGTSARTAAGIVFISATGTNPFTFGGNQLTVGSSGIVNNDVDTQVFDATMNFVVGADQTWNAAAGDLRMDGDINVNAKTLTIAGSHNTTFTGNILVGATPNTGNLIKQGSGTLTFDYLMGTYTGQLTVQQGTMYIKYAGSLPVPNTTVVTGGMLWFEPTVNFNGFEAGVTIDGGGTIKLAPLGQIANVLNGGSLTFGTGGGTLDLASQLTAGISLGSVTVNSAAATPGVIKYGTIANSTTGALGWDSAGKDLNIANGNLLGTGALKFDLNNGAMVQYQQSTFGGSANFSGVSGGNAAVGSSGTTVGRLLLDTGTTFGFTGGLTFDNAMQVSINTGAARTLDANITINSGETAFQGASSSAAQYALTLGSTVGGKTITVKDGAALTFDQRFRTDSANNKIGGITVNANTVLEAGATMNFRKSAGVAGETVGTVTVNGDITGQGTATKESTVNVGLNSGNLAFATGANTAGSDLIVNGSGTGGLRVQGTQANVDNLLTAARIQDVTGTGGTLTIAYSDNVTKNFVSAPTTASSVRLGFDAQSGSSPVYQIGAAINDLNRWGGLVVKGGTVNTMFNESFTGSASQVTSLDLLGGNLVLNSGTLARTLTFEGGANLTGGTLDGGSVGGAGNLVIAGDLTHGSAALVNSPNIIMNVSAAANISGSAITGIGTLTKMGASTVTVQTGVGANLIDIQAGTLLMGGNNLIADSTAIKLSGGTLGINGKSDAVGTLTLAANSTVDFGGGSSVINFANSSASTWTGGTTLTIANWDGNWSGGGADQLVFGSALSALGAGQVSQIKFLNPGGVTGLFNARILATGEIVPVPEPATIGFGALLLGSLGLRERSRLTKFLRSLKKRFA
jgi:autotransporter-associated beta strand protein